MSDRRTTIVSVADLAAHPEWRIFDCSHAMSDPDAGAQSYAQQHIPGALHAKMEGVLSGERSAHSGRNPLPKPRDFADFLGQAGIEPGDQVVCYDRSGNAAATRMWWLLRWIGHEAVAVLDGGMQAWVDAGQTLTGDLPIIEPAQFQAQVNDALHVGADVMKDTLGQQQMTVVDARGADKFAGINETTDPKGGHIPGSQNRPYTQNVTQDGLFKSPEMLGREWALILDGRPPSQMIASCGSGVSACHNLISLEIAGLSGARLYPGSWSQWCSDPENPIET